MGIFVALSQNEKCVGGGEGLYSKVKGLLITMLCIGSGRSGYLVGGQGADRRKLRI